MSSVNRMQFAHEGKKSAPPPMPAGVPLSAAEPPSAPSGPADPSSSLKLLLHHASQTVYTWNLQDHSIHWGEGVETKLPFLASGETMSESRWLAMVHPEDRLRMLQLRERLMAERHFASQEYFTIDYRVQVNDVTYDIRQAGIRGESAMSQVVTGIIDVRTPSPGQAKLGEYHQPAHFAKLLQQRIDACAHSESEGGLLLVRIANLAMIMNGYGSETAETAVRQLMMRIRDTLAEDDVIERLSRDEIGIILAQAYSEDVARIASRINHIVQNYGRDSFETASLHIICVIGSLAFPVDCNNATDALNKAYVALHSEQATFHRSFESTRKAADMCRQQMGLANYLHKALRDHRIRLAYQPVIETSTGRVSHYEALLRMINQNGKISSAGALIPIAERMGLIHIIDTLVLEMVVKELRRSTKVSLAFNVSNLTTENSLWLETLTELLKETPEIAPRLVVEITETAAHRDLRRAAYFVASIQAMGCQVALDDFGSGYTSFRQLKALSVDLVKIDGVFIKDLAVNTDNRFFVKTLLDFTKGFGLSAVAEFVENGEIAKILIDMGVDYMQGYYFGQPENHRSWLDKGEFGSN